VLAQAIATVNAVALTLALASVVLIVWLRGVRPSWPGILITVVLAALATFVLKLPVETVGTRFGGLPSSLAAPALPPASADLMLAVLPNAIAIALLGAIESLLSAVVADGMAKTSHRPNIELIAQGIANAATACFGGICVTGTIARTATNIRAGGETPVAGMLHSVFLLLFLLLAAPLATHIPLAALAAVLMVVCWNMIDAKGIKALLRGDRGSAAVMLVTLAVTLARDLTEGMAAGIALHLLFMLARRIRA
jgi:sulfate permease, SulP family